MIKNNESTEEFKIVKAKKRKERKERCKLNGNESCLHDYANENQLKKEKENQLNQNHLKHQKQNNGFLKL